MIEAVTTALSEISLLALHCGYKEGRKTAENTVNITHNCCRHNVWPGVRLEHKLVFFKPSHNIPEVQTLKTRPDGDLYLYLKTEHPVEA